MSYFSYFKKIFCFKRKKVFSIKEQLDEYLDIMQKKAIENIKKCFEENETFALFVHKNADPDSLCSAIALSSALRNQGKKTKVIALEKINSQSKKILSYYPYPILYEYDFKENNDIYVLLDAPDFTSIKTDITILKSKIIIIIDHHHKENVKYINTISLISQEATSTAILLYFLFKQTNHIITKEIAIFLLFGIVADTGFLKQANNMDFIALFELSQYENLNNIKHILKKEKNKNERIEILKAMIRLKIYQFGDDILGGYTYAGSYGASVALTNIYAGCDIIFVETRGKNKISVSGRLRKHLENKINLASVLSNIAGKYRKYNGTGGGHKSAASMKINVPDNVCLGLEKQIITFLEKKLNKKSKIIKI